MTTLFRMVFCPGWTCVSATELELVSTLHSRQDNLPPRPLLVMDRDGGTQAASYTALSSLLRSDKGSHDKIKCFILRQC